MIFEEIGAYIAKEIHVKTQQVQAVIKLLDDGNTVPFIARYRKESGDTMVFLCTLPNTNEKTVGARSHPGELSHKKAAEELTLFLKEIL